MRLEQFKYLIEVSRTRSMHMAGKNLFVSQQAISMAIKNLEEELNVKIFVRTSKGMYLTDEGEKVLQAAKDIFERIDRLKKELGGTVGYVPETITILVHSGMLMSLMPQIIESLCKTFKQDQLKILQSQLNAIIEKLERGEAQIGLFYATDAELAEFEKRNLKCVKIDAFNFGVLVNENSRFSRMESVSLEEVVTQYPLMLYEELGSDNNTTEKLLKEYGLAEQASYISVKENMALQLLESDNAVLVGFQNKSNLMIEKSFKHCRFVYLNDSSKIYSVYAYNEEKTPTRVVEIIRKNIKGDHV